MRKIILILILFSSYLVSAQQLQYVNTYGYDYNKFKVRDLLGIPADTFAVPSSLLNVPFIANKAGTLYIWDITAHTWGSYGGQNFANTDLIFTGNRIHNLNTFDLRIHNGTFELETPGGDGFIMVNGTTSIITGALNLLANVASNQIILNAGQRLRLGTNAADLATPVNGDMFYNSALNKFRAYENGAWTNMIGGGSGANTALSNLTTTSINQYLLPGITDTYDLGTTALSWRRIYAYELIIKGELGGEVTVVASEPTDSYTFILPENDGNPGEVLSTTGTSTTDWVPMGGNLIVDSIGVTGTEVIVARNDSLLHRLITAGANITVDTLSTGEIRITGTGGVGSQTPWTSNINADGFSLDGNDGSGQTLTLRSTSHATKGNILFGNSVYDEVNNRLGISGTPGFKHDVWGSASDLIVMGGELAAATRTNSTTKFGAYGIPHYTLAQLPLVLIRGSSGVGSNIVNIGYGITGAGNSATSIEIGTAANNTTATATRRINLTNTEITFNDGLFNHNFIVGADVTTNMLVVDANGLTNGAVGVGTATPTSILQVAGSFSLPYTATATSLAADATHHTIDVTATGQTITLPTAVGISGRIYTIKLTASGSGTVATTSSQNIDGSTTYSLASQYKYVTVQSTNAGWVVIANN